MSKRPFNETLLRILLLTLVACATMMAQESRATITGNVTDPQGAAMPGANVVAKNPATNAEVKAASNESGLYVLPLLNAGTWTVTATAVGFKAAVDNSVELRASERHSSISRWRWAA